RAQDAGQVPTAKNEELQDGVKYTLDKPHLEAVKEVMQQMKQGGFVAQGGSYQDQQKTVMRMNNSSETLIITVIQPDLKVSQSVVEIYSIKKK
ncbi:MAG: hypothetical protein M1383_00605, partial [Patescibacteria group bacterium]|nr:hypothetical protein [Patescibacteria group bacterium]